MHAAQVFQDCGTYVTDPSDEIWQVRPRAREEPAQNPSPTTKSQLILQSELRRRSRQETPTPRPRAEALQAARMHDPDSGQPNLRKAAIYLSAERLDAERAEASEPVAVDVDKGLLSSMIAQSLLKDSALCRQSPLSHRADCGKGAKTLACLRADQQDQDSSRALSACEVAMGSAAASARSAALSAAAAIRMRNGCKKLFAAVKKVHTSSNFKESSATAKHHSQDGGNRLERWRKDHRSRHRMAESEEKTEGQTGGQSEEKTEVEEQLEDENRAHESVLSAFPTLGALFPWPPPGVSDGPGERSTDGCPGGSRRRERQSSKSLYRTSAEFSLAGFAH